MVVVLALDGHAHSQAILHQLGTVWCLPEHVSRLILVSVVDTTYIPGAKILDFGEGTSDRAQVESRLQQALEQLGPWRQRAEYAICAGEPGPQIVKLVKETQARLVIMGRGQAHNHDRALLGSVSAHVVAHSPCTVVVVKEPEPS